jgi:hypothetical protein
MPLVMAERVRSRRSQLAVDSANGSIVRNYFVMGGSDDLAVRALCDSVIEPTYGGMYYHNYAIDPVGPAFWDVTVNYFSTLPKSSTAPVFSFDTTGGTAHVNVSKATVRSYGLNDDEAPDYFGAIGVNGDSVEGCDVVVPQFSFSVTAYVPRALVTSAYRRVLFGLTGRTNDKPWNGFEEGEVLFLGAQGSVRGYELWEIQFKFAASPNRLADSPAGFLYVGRSTLNVEKRGWEYLWVRYADVVDGAAKAIVRRPASAYVERVYDAGDFDLLGLESF